MLKEQCKELLLRHYASNPSPDLTADMVANEIVQLVLEWMIPIQTDCLISAIKKLQEAK